jgi:hypothetical protein
LIGQHAVREFYAESGFMTSTGNHAALIELLPDDVGQLVRIIHGLAIYDVVASDFTAYNSGTIARLTFTPGPSRRC